MVSKMTLKTADSRPVHIKLSFVRVSANTVQRAPYISNLRWPIRLKLEKCKGITTSFTLSQFQHITCNCTYETPYCNCIFLFVFLYLFFVLVLYLYNCIFQIYVVSIKFWAWKKKIIISHRTAEIFHHAQRVRDRTLRKLAFKSVGKYNLISVLFNSLI